MDHAKTVAALLTASGIKARAVSGYTGAAVRRRVVNEFREGEVKALVNYAVFREGFDAPKTRAIIVARPVYSPNLYFQMIGRGLRRVVNGSNDRCLILNVEDNIENFEGRLAFTELECFGTDTETLTEAQDFRTPIGPAVSRLLCLLSVPRETLPA